MTFCYIPLILSHHSLSDITKISGQLLKIFTKQKKTYSISADKETFCSADAFSPSRLSRLGRLQTFISAASN